MIKILSSDQIRQADAHTIEHEPISSLDLMERAAKRCFNQILKDFPNCRSVDVVCGVGNNGGDGLVIARRLYEQGWEVDLWIIRFSDRCSDDFDTNLERLPEGVAIKDVESSESLCLSKNLIVDCIFGSGLSRPAEGLCAEVIHLINLCRQPVVSIDIPSGLFDSSNDELAIRNSVNADLTYCFECPKLSFMVPGSGEKVGVFRILDIGLDKEFISGQNSSFYYLEQEDIVGFRRPLAKFAHKGTMGRCMLVAGSKGMMGAAVLSAKSALRSGIGLLTMLVPECGYDIVQSSVHEALCLTEGLDWVDNIRISEGTKSIGVGPGIGKQKDTAAAMKSLCLDYQIPLVIDADALNILAENKTWLEFLPGGSILTPHIGEFTRLFGECSDPVERIKLASERSVRYNIHIVLKGAHSAICTPSGQVFFNSTGNPGMATGGSGDVLTGVLTALIAQGYSTTEACLIGVFVHGLAGDLTKEKLGTTSLIASDMVDALPAAYSLLDERS